MWHPRSSNRVAAAVLQGAFAALAVHGVALAARGTVRPLSPRALDERTGRIREVLLHYAPRAGFVRATYADFLRRLPRQVRVRLACERLEDAREFALAFGREVEPLVIGRPITPWSRDRFVTCADGSLLVPPEPHAGGPERTNDALVPLALAQALGTAARPAPFRFDGGDFLAADGWLFTTASWTRRNPERAPEELLQAAEDRLGLPILFFPEAPEHHVGMALAAVAPGRLLVGDARWGARLAPAFLDVDDREATARRFDAMADRLAAAGFRVDRIPVAPTRREFAWITYTNGLFDDGTVYLPTYGLPPLDGAAEAVYRGLGYEVRPVDVSAVYGYGGTLHCLVHVTSRTEGMSSRE